MRGVLFFVFLVFGIAHGFENEVHKYGCRCLQKDLTVNPLVRLRVLEQENESTGSSIYTKINILRKWLANLTLHKNGPIPTTTTTTTTTTPSNLLAEPFDEALNNSSFLWFAGKMLEKYFRRFTKEMHIFDKFECVCDGDLIALTRSKTFINIKITHD
ncbi:unnamed protein product [Caenorhabditis angaria]|uniref:DUF38 domain-containing protein n=1 Tax=Caenorhabditis angaria TaxID=860376 RepID=A0A9P1IQ81_9PELO|nr:unnamed protein product [Caenorhabditis angaria]